MKQNIMFLKNDVGLNHSDFIPKQLACQKQYSNKVTGWSHLTGTNTFASSHHYCCLYLKRAEIFVATCWCADWLYKKLEEAGRKDDRRRATVLKYILLYMMLDRVFQLVSKTNRSWTTVLQIKFLLLSYNSEINSKKLHEYVLLTKIHNTEEKLRQPNAHSSKRPW